MEIFRDDLPINEDIIYFDKPCKSFKKYKGIQIPRCGCEACWKKYFKKHPDELAVLVENMRNDVKSRRTEINTVVGLCDHPKSILVRHDSNWDGWSINVCVEYTEVRRCNICGEQFSKVTHGLK
jgi:hypothetical protein